MSGKSTLLAGLASVLALLFLIQGSAQQQPPQLPAQPSNPTPGCSATPAQLEANKKVAMQFFRTIGADRVALADPSYKQHNPAFKKRAEDNHVSDYDEFKSTFLAQAAGQGLAAPAPVAAGTRPPAGNPFEVVTAECDIVTLVHKTYRQDPATEPGKFYEVFTFDTFRIANGKFVEHWDGAVINPPVPAAPAGR